MFHIAGAFKTKFLEGRKKAASLLEVTTFLPLG